MPRPYPYAYVRYVNVHTSPTHVIYNTRARVYIRSMYSQTHMYIMIIRVKRVCSCTHIYIYIHTYTIYCYTSIYISFDQLIRGRYLYTYQYSQLVWNTHDITIICLCRLDWTDTMALVRTTRTRTCCATRAYSQYLLHSYTLA